ncbi:MAG: glycerol-3-phosphate 1-O-acyltransferase PlsY [Ruminococcaceae bacterium]|nr:glycerol-3-phosphate 1-O-acyltransferase PlsY [Oscillospiraceae bacterium]
MSNTVLFLTLIFAAVSYLIGSINTGILVSELIYKDDVRNHGSGNAGATNVLRTYGKKAALITVLGDALKGVVAVVLAMLICPVFNVDAHFIRVIMYVSALCAVLGHNYPLYFRFKGGKGVLTSVTVIIMLDPVIGLIALVVSISIMAISKYVSLGSVTGALIVIILSVILRRNDIWFIVLCFVLGLLLILRHTSNIKRLIKGEESKLGEKKKG